MEPLTHGQKQDMLLRAMPDGVDLSMPELSAAAERLGDRWQLAGFATAVVAHALASRPEHVNSQVRVTLAAPTPA